MLSTEGLVAFTVDAIGLSKRSFLARYFRAEDCVLLAVDSDVILCSMLQVGLGLDDNEALLVSVEIEGWKFSTMFY